jgi:hypothetical protein
MNDVAVAGSSNQQKVRGGQREKKLHLFWREKDDLFESAQTGRHTLLRKTNNCTL